MEDNVCFKAVGHGYFLEEGGEVDTLFSGNLGAGNTRTNRLTKTDGYETVDFTKCTVYKRGKGCNLLVHDNHKYALPLIISLTIL